VSKPVSAESDAAAGADGHPRFVWVPPKSVHRMLLTLERGWLASRKPCVPRKIAVLADRSALPALEPGGMANRSRPPAKEC
jgi:hypothetical protein